MDGDYGPAKGSGPSDNGPYSGGPPMNTGGPPMGGDPIGGAPPGGGNSNPLTGPPPALNEDGLPIRPGKENCLYYLNTGTCRSGTQCIFNHPPKVERENELKKSLNKAGMPAPEGGNIMPQIDGPSSAPVNAGSGLPPPSTSLGMAGMLEKLEALQAENKPPNDQGKNDPDKPWEHIDGPEDFPAAGGSPDAPKPFEPPKEVVYNEEGLPIRPGVQKCGHFLRSGKCTYGPTCRFDHPAGLGGLMASPGFGSFPGIPGGMLGGSSGMIGGPLTDGALAMRPGKDQCPFLAKTGSCPFGPECRFDHSGEKPAETHTHSKPVEPPLSRKKEKGLGGTRGRRPPPMQASKRR